MNKFTKILSVVLSVILSVNTFSIGAFAAVTPPAGKILLTTDNLIVKEFICTGTNVYPAPVLVYREIKDDGTTVDHTLDPLVDYTIRYTNFQNLTTTAAFEVIGRNNYTTKDRLIKSVNVQSPVNPSVPPKSFNVALDREFVNESDTKAEARTYTYLDNMNFVITLPANAEGSLNFFVGSTQLNTTAINIDKMSMAFSYNTSLDLVQAGPNSKHFAVRVVWTDKSGNAYTNFLVGITLNKFDLSTATYKDIPQREVIPGVAYEPHITIKSPEFKLTNGPNCKIEYFNNILESNSQYPTKAVVTGSGNFTGTKDIPFTLFLNENVTTGIVCDRYDKTYTYGDIVVFTAYVRSGIGGTDTAKFVCNNVVIGTAPVKYDGKNGTAILNYKTSGEEFNVYDTATGNLKNSISVEFESQPGTTASVGDVIMLPKKIDVVVHCKDKIYDGTNKAAIPIGINAKNYTFVGKVKETDNLKVEDENIGGAEFSGAFSSVDSDWYAGNAKATRATNFIVTGAHKRFYIFPDYAYGTAKISKKHDPTLIVTNSPSDLSTYVYSSDQEEFSLKDIPITVDNDSRDPHIGELDFKINTLVDIDRGGIFDGKLEIKDKAIQYKVKDIEVEDPAQKASLTLVVSSTNYTDIMTNISFTLIKKKWAKIDGFSVASKVYDGLPVVLQGKAAITSEDNNLLVSSKDLVFSYVSSDGGSYTGAQPPNMPGKYYAVITLPKTSYGYYAKTSIPFTIEKATITVSTPSFEIYQGQETLPEVPISFTGFVNKEAVGVFNTNTLKAVHSTPDTILPGTFVVTFTGEVTSDRYNFTYAPGTLTIIKVAKYPAVDPIPEKITNTSVYLPKASYPDKILSFEELALSINVVVPSDDRLITQVIQQKTGFKNYKKMDIKLIEVLTGKAVQPKGKVTISVPYPTGSDSTMNFKVLHLYKNSTKIEMIIPTKVVGGLQFQVSEFSAFVIGWEKPLASEDTDFFITNAQIKTEKKQFNVTVREDARKASYALTKFFQESTREKSVVFNNPDVTITFEKNALSIKEVMSSYDFYATKNSCEHEVAARAAGGENVVAVVHFNHQGYWPGLAQVNINIGEDRKGEELAYYYYNPSTASLDYVSKATVDKDGWFTVDQDHCSDYVVSSEFPKAIPTPSPSPSPSPTPEPEPEEKASFLTNVWNFIKAIPAFVMALPGNIKSFISNATATFKNVTQAVSKVFKNVTTFFAKVTSPVSKFFGKIADAVGGVVDKIKDVVSGVMEKVTGAIDGVKETVGDGVNAAKENPILSLGVLIAILLLALIGFIIVKIIEKNKAAKGYSDGSDAINENGDNAKGNGDENDAEASKVEAPPKTAAEVDDSIEY